MLSMLMTTEYAPAEERRELRQLLFRIAGGEREALAELYQRTRSAVYGLALSYLKTRTTRRISHRTSMCRCGTARSSTDSSDNQWAGCWQCAEISA